MEFDEAQNSGRCRPAPAQDFLDVPGAAAAAYAHIRSIMGMSRRWSFLTIVEPEPNPDSRVLLDDVKDRFGQRRVKLDWRLTPLVEKSLRYAQKAIVRDLRAVGLDCAVEGSSGAAGNQSIDEPRWVWHHMGTHEQRSDPGRRQPRITPMQPTTIGAEDRVSFSLKAISASVMEPIIMRMGRFGQIVSQARLIWLAGRGGAVKPSEAAAPIPTRFANRRHGVAAMRLSNSP